VKIYWYAPWPDDRAWVSVPLARLIATDTDELVVQTLQPTVPDRAQEARGPVCVVADLPVVSRARQWTPGWWVNRVAVYVGRARRRNALVRALRPDVVHLQLLNRFTDVWSMPRGSVVATVHDVLPHRRRLSWRAERALLTRLYSRLEAIVVHHPMVSAQLRADFRVRGDAIHFIPLVIAPNDAVRTHRDLSSPTVLFFGSFRLNKGVEQLCDAIRLLAGEAHLRFHFAGRGDPGVERLVVDLARSDPRVTADIGYVSNDVKDTLFRTASLVVLPYTTFSSQSAVLGDAYAAGTPAVVADVGALGASVREDGTGWVLPSTSAVDIATTIRTALSDADAWEERSERADTVAAERSPEAVARGYRALYETLRPRSPD
jgi:glycosyltransferase involved in cell wall biosynthesis